MVIRSLPALPPPVDEARIEALATELTALTPIRQGDELIRLSSDFHAYSPVLEPLLAPCRAQLAVRAHSVEQVRLVASACARHSVPLTLRGAGTGNYGQCVPLRGGLVLDLSGLRQLRQLDPVSGVVTAEAGITLASLDLQLATQGRSLRLAPSTLRTASLGGFIAGGAGGVGSLRWGFLRDPGNLLGLEVLTVEPEPRLLQLDAAASAPLNHAYGTNGIVTALTLPSCAAVDWRQLVVGFPHWEEALAALQELSHTALLLNNAALLEAPVAAALPWQANTGCCCWPPPMRWPCCRPGCRPGAEPSTGRRPRRAAAACRCGSCAGTTRRCTGAARIPTGPTCSCCYPRTRGQPWRRCGNGGGRIWCGTWRWCASRERRASPACHCCASAASRRCRR